MNERTILERVHDLAEAEKRSLRERSAGADGGERLARIEDKLDQCWDQLRQPRAKREFGADPGRTPARDSGTAEGHTR